MASGLAGGSAQRGMAAIKTCKIPALMRYPFKTIETSVTGGPPSFNHRRARPAAAFLLLLLILQGLLPAPAQARKKKRRRVLKAIQVHQIAVDTQNVFDPTIPGENLWLFRLANWIHVPTKPGIIRRELLVYPGAWTTLERVAESERELRTLPFIKEARIIQTPVGEDRVDLLVRTQDRSEEHTSELQSRQYLVCRLLL